MVPHKCLPLHRIGLYYCCACRATLAGVSRQSEAALTLKAEGGATVTLNAEDRNRTSTCAAQDLFDILAQPGIKSSSSTTTACSVACGIQVVSDGRVRLRIKVLGRNQGRPQPIAHKVAHNRSLSNSLASGEGP